MAVAFSSAKTPYGPPDENDVSSFSSTESLGGGSVTLAIVTVTLRTDTGQTITALTYGGTTLTQITAITSGNLRTEAWYFVSPSASATLAITFSAATYFVASYTTYTGSHTSTPIGTIGSQARNDTSVSASVTLSAGDLAAAFGGAVDDALIITDNGGQTNRAAGSVSNGNPGGVFYADISDKGGTGSVTLGFSSDTTADLGVIVVPIKVASATVPTIDGWLPNSIYNDWLPLAFRINSDRALVAIIVSGVGGGGSTTEPLPNVTYVPCSCTVRRKRRYS